jgi:hypothetical protein
MASPYMPDAKGRLLPVEMIKRADGLSAQVTRFKVHTFDDFEAIYALLAQDYGAKKGGAKGNKTFMTFDALKKAQVKVADTIDFLAQL